ncbi:MAG: hypothetical protein GXP31_08845 [Kiritimatiellaeota bacterium]|nr:hypothetical protein [Kiritimatiellota bacterium]
MNTIVIPFREFLNCRVGANCERCVCRIDVRDNLVFESPASNIEDTGISGGLVYPVHICANLVLVNALPGRRQPVGGRSR